MINVPDPVQATKRWSPIFIFLVFAILTLVTLLKGLQNLHLNLSFPQSLAIAVGIGLADSVIGWLLINRITVAKAVDDEDTIILSTMSVDLRSIARLSRRLHTKTTEAAAVYIEDIQGHVDQLTDMVEQSEARMQTREDFQFVEKIFT